MVWRSTLAVVTGRACGPDVVAPLCAGWAAGAQAASTCPTKTAAVPAATSRRALRVIGFLLISCGSIGGERRFWDNNTGHRPSHRTAGHAPCAGIPPAGRPGAQPAGQVLQIVKAGVERRYEE